MTLRTLACTLALVAASTAFAALKAGDPAPAFTAPASLAGKPFTYTPSPIDIALPEDATSDTQPTTPNPTSGCFPPKMPWDEQGYCATQQTIEYVDQDGNFLYSEM